MVFVLERFLTGLLLHEDSRIIVNPERYNLLMSGVIAMVLTNGPSSKDYDVGETLRGLIKSRRLLHPI